MALEKKSATGAFDRDFVLMVNTPVKNPADGLTNIWTKGTEFRGALSILKSTDAMIAQAQTGIEMGILAVNKENRFPIDTHFLDPQNDKYYRVTNTGQESSSAISFEQIQYAVVWAPVLPV